MSGSANPPRSPDEIARILVDAETFSVTYAARRHRIHRNTVRNLRIEWADDPRVVRICARIRKRAESAWVREVKAARQELLERTLILAGRTKSLRAAIEALRRVAELAIVDEVLNPDEGTAGVESKQPHQPKAARTDEGDAG